MLGQSLKGVVALLSVSPHYSTHNGTVYLCCFVAISPYKFSVCDTTGAEFSVYSGGGVVCQVKTPKSHTFVSRLIAHMLILGLCNS